LLSDSDISSFGCLLANIASGVDKRHMMGLSLKIQFKTDRLLESGNENCKHAEKLKGLATFLRSTCDGVIYLFVVLMTTSDRNEQQVRILHSDNLKLKMLKET